MCDLSFHKSHVQLTNLGSQSKGFNYGFVEYDDPGAAERAMQTLNGRRIHQSVSFAPRNFVLRLLTSAGNPRQLGVPV